MKKLLPVVLVSLALLGAACSKSPTGTTNTGLTQLPSASNQPMPTNSASSRPDCPTPLLQPPVNTQLATGILYPGQTRGNEYKAHGGFRFDNATSNAMVVKSPMDGQLNRVGRYTVSGQVQYLLEFSSPCGVSFRFDHLLALSPRFAAVANAFPQTGENDSHTNPVQPPLDVTVGETVATQVGITHNVFFDFGVYDMRQKNAASQDPAWAASHTEPVDSYGICWLNFLPASDVLTVKALPGGDQTAGKTSDYCT